VSGERLRIGVLGYVVRGPTGGMAWHHLQYVLGLAELGHDVRFAEDSEDYPSCYDPRGRRMTTDPNYGLAFARRAFARLGLGDAWAYHDRHSGRWAGPARDAIEAFFRSADVVLNLSGVNPVRPWWSGVPVRCFVDTDPAFTQIRHLTDPRRRELADAHTSFWTYGENVAGGRATSPDDGYPWQATRQPVVLSAWPVTPAPAAAPFTTVMSWKSYRPLEWDGRTYGLKAESFDAYLSLPRRTRASFELALVAEGERRAALERAGWVVRDPQEVAADPWAYQRYLQRSAGEFSVAKHGYVAGRTGWFSERTAAYLASGRPAVVEDTGFTEWLEADAGVLAFASPDEAAAAIEAVRADHARHAAAAREVAAAYFDSARVLTELLQAVGTARAHPHARA
jgi:hypothetical protein